MRQAVFQGSGERVSMEDEKRRAYNEFFAERILSILTVEQTDQKREDLLADLLSLGVKAA